MLEQPSLASEKRRLTRMWRLFGYFLLLGLLARASRELISSLQQVPSLAGFVKVNQLITESLDVSASRDASLATLWSLALTLLLVVPLGRVYLATKTADYDPGFVKTIVAMSLAACAMMMIIQDNFSRAIGLVAVVSSVRFRTTLKNPADGVYLLIALGIGMGCGLAMFMVSAWLSFVLCVTFLVLWRFRIGELSPEEIAVAAQKKRKKKKSKKCKFIPPRNDEEFPPQMAVGDTENVKTK